jgi:hypothetical protein
LEKGLSTADIPNWNGPKCFLDTFTELIEHVAYEVAPSDMKKERPPWSEMSADELLDAIAMRDTATIIHMRNPDLDTKAKLVTTRKHVKRVVKEAKVGWIQTK